MLALKQPLQVRIVVLVAAAVVVGLAGVDVQDPDDLLDLIRDEETGMVLEDRRAPDLSGDRETLEYQGIDPDTRGPFAQASGGFRPGGSMFS